MIARTLPFFLVASAFAQEATTVRTVAPAPATEARTFDLPGRTEPIEQARIFSRATGTVKERPLDIGDRVKEGDTLFIVEAMKTMNAITAPKGGTVKEISVADGTPVEFGQTLCVIA